MRIRTIEDFERFLSREIIAFEKSAKFARRRGLGRLDVHCQGVADAYRVARAVIRTSLLPDQVEPGDVLTTVIVTNPVPARLRKKMKIVEKKT